MSHHAGQPSVIDAVLQAQPPRFTEEQAARIGADTFGEQVGLDEGEQASLYYIAVLAWGGCVADTPEVARWFGDDIAFRADS